MSEDQEVREWIKWYCEKPINVREIYGDAFEFTEEEKRLTKLIKASRGEE